MFVRFIALLTVCAPCAAQCGGAEPGLGLPYCLANPNSSGTAATLTAAGQPDPSANCFELTATGVAPDEFGYFLMSPGQGYVPLFGGSAGNLCLGIPTYRFAQDVLTSSPAGVMRFSPDLTALPQGAVIAGGGTWSFQLWFRDGATSNTSNGLVHTFATGADPAVQFPLVIHSVVEESSSVPLPVTLSEPAPHDVLVHYSISGSATAGVDFHVLSPNPMVIPAGDVRSELVFAVVEDAHQELDETVLATITQTTGGVLGTSTDAVLMIANDD